MRMVKYKYAVCLLSLLFAQVSLADLYQYRDSGGVTHFTDDPRKVPAAVRERGKRTMDPLPSSSSPADEQHKRPPLDERAGGSATGEQHMTGWMLNSGFQGVFDRMVADGYYASHVEGRLYRGVMQFRGSFKPFFKGLNRFYAYHGMPDELYKQRQAALQAEGFRELYHNSFEDASGRRRHQACWLEVL